MEDYWRDIGTKKLTSKFHPKMYPTGLNLEDI
jgi:hypothetical protein